MNTKRWAAVCLALMLIVMNAIAADGVATGTMNEAPTPLEKWISGKREEIPKSLFGESVRVMTSLSYGSSADCLAAGDWTVKSGYDDEGVWRMRVDWLGFQRAALAERGSMRVVPCGDQIAYDGGEAGWMMRPLTDGDPVQLGLGRESDVLFSDERFLWYASYSEDGNATLGRMNHRGGRKVKLAAVEGGVMAMMRDGSALIQHVEENRISLWKDGKLTTIYEPEELIVRVVCYGRNIWVQHEGKFGLLQDGELKFAFAGTIIDAVGTTDQTAMLISQGEGAQQALMLFNEAQGAYALVGYAPASDGALIELRPPCGLKVWGPDWERQYATPARGEFIPYGYADVRSAIKGGYVLRERVARSEDLRAEDNGGIARRMPGELVLEGEDEILRRAQWQGIHVTREPDGAYSYRAMTLAQHERELFRRERELIECLDAMQREGLITSYACSDDFSEIALRVDRERAADGLLNELVPVGLLAAAYQAMLYDAEEPVAIIELFDEETGERLDDVLDSNIKQPMGELHAPGDLLFG